MTLLELKTELENRTNFRFEIKKNIIDTEILNLIGLTKKTEIYLSLRQHIKPQKQFISVNATDKRNGYSGHGCPCDTIDEAIEWLKRYSAEYGWKAQDEQISLFKEESK